MPNGGALYNGGVPGNRGGGRPADRVRAVMLEGLEKAAPRLIRIAFDEGSKDSDVINACNALAKIGLPLQIEGGDSPIQLTIAERREALA